jgi:hypothetical protein
VIEMKAEECKVQDVGHTNRCKVQYTLGVAKQSAFAMKQVSIPVEPVDAKVSHRDAFEPESLA